MRRHSSSLAVAALVWLASCEGGVDPRTAVVTSQLTVMPGFQDQLVLGGLSQPTAVRFAKDGRVFIAEKSGLIKVLDPSQAPEPAVFADLRTQVHNYWDRGLLDLELHPDFPETPFLYVLYTFDAELGGAPPRWGIGGVSADRCPTPPGPTDKGCLASGRLSRLEASGNSMRGVEQVLIENWPQQFPSHSLGSIVFGPDAMLYVSAGDGAHFDFVDYGQRGDPVNPFGDPPVGIGVEQTPPTARGGALRAQNVSVAGAAVLFNGKLLRVDPATGLAAPGNPLAGSPAEAIIASGLRNPFRMTFRPGTGELWIGDVGWNRWDEIDRLTDPVGSIVENFGWPCFEGPERQPAYEATGLDVCNSLYSANNQVVPYYAYRIGEPVIAGDGCGSGQAAITGLAFYSEGVYPAEYSGALFFSDYARNCIWAMMPGPDGLPNPLDRRVFVHGAPQPVQLLIGPGNDLYYTSQVGELHRIAALGTNQPPLAGFSATPYAGPIPLTVSFDGSESSDSDPGDSLTYAWDLDGDGAFDDATTVTPVYVYSAAAERQVGLRVTDSRGAVATAFHTISAGDAGGGPRAEINPPDSTQFRVGDTVRFEGLAFDGALPLPAANMQWDLVVQHCPVVDTCHPHVIESFEAVAAGSFIAPEHDYPYYLQLILRVTAADGRQGTAVVRLDPITVELSIDSVPRGLVLAFNQNAQATPFSATVALGSANTLSAASYAGYDFVAWSDGGAAVHVLSANGPAELVATYQLRATPASLKQLGSIVARVSTPTGGGNASFEVIRDDDYPPPGTQDSLRQYDTLTADREPKDDWIGYGLGAPYVFSRVAFQEGLNFADGGWFEQLGVRVRQNGIWTAVRSASVRPLYPGTSNGVGFRSYELEFEAATGDAIQIIGPAGGSARFVSVGELDVYGWRVIPGSDSPPLARIAAMPTLVLPGDEVILDARGSFAPNGEPVAFAWTQSAGPGVTLMDADGSQPRFVAPAVSAATTLRFSLIVSTGALASAAASVEVLVSSLAEPVDISSRGRILISEPVPIGGGNPNVEIIRDGIEPAVGSTELSTHYDTYAGAAGAVEGFVGYELGKSYRLGEFLFQEGAELFDGGWFSALGVEVRQNGRWFPAHGLQSTPAYPNASDGVGFQTYRLTFTPMLGDAIRLFGTPAGTARFFSVAELHVFAVPAPAGNAPPAAHAGADFAAVSGVPVSLDATLSFDPDGSTVRYAWQQIGGAAVRLDDPTSPLARFVAPSGSAATLTFGLTVDDGSAKSELDSVTVTVERGHTPVDVTPLGVILASVRRPLGASNHDLEVIRDGIAPPLAATGPGLQYDTYTGTLANEAWLGYQFPQGRTFARLEFQEGLEFADGGWFNTLGVQVRRGGLWNDVGGLTIAPSYPFVNDGQGWQSYTLGFTPIVGEAIRIFGIPGGSWTFVSVAELRVYTP